MEASGQLYSQPVVLMGKACPVQIGYEAGWVQQLIWMFRGKVFFPCQKLNYSSSDVQPIG